MKPTILIAGHVFGQPAEQKHAVSWPMEVADNFEAGSRMALAKAREMAPSAIF
jgi:hypothetical protein